MTNVTIKTDESTADDAITDKKTLTNMLNSEDLSLEEKLAAIEKAMESAQVKGAAGGTAAPQDPQDLLMCDSCQ